MGDFSDIFHSLGVGLPFFLGHLILTIAIWIAAMGVCFLLTPYHPVRGIRAGNVSAAVSAGGAALGTAIPLAFCLAGAINGWDILLWAVPVMLVQLLAFGLTGLVIPGLPDRIDGGDLAAAIFLLFFRIGFACINAAAIAS
jgi:putative membrane protein